MFEGQYLFHNAAVFSPWFGRGGDNVRVLGQLIKKATANIDVTVLTKAAEDAGDGTAVTGTLTLDTEGVVEDQEFTGLKDLVRFKFTATGTTSAHYALFRMLDLVWFDTITTA